MESISRKELKESSSGEVLRGVTVTAGNGLGVRVGVIGAGIGAREIIVGAAGAEGAPKAERSKFPPKFPDWEVAVDDLSWEKSRGAEGLEKAWSKSSKVNEAGFAYERKITTNSGGGRVSDLGFRV